MLRALRPFWRPARIVPLVGGPILDLFRQLGYLLGGRAVQQHPDAPASTQHTRVTIRTKLRLLAVVWTADDNYV
jgi:hypothetical protein